MSKSDENEEMSTSLPFPTVRSYAVPSAIEIESDDDEEENEEVNVRYVDRKGRELKTFAI